MTTFTATSVIRQWINSTLDGAPLALTGQPGRFANDIGDTFEQPGWRYFTNVRVSHPLTGSLRTRFSANVGGIVRCMDMHMPAVATREFANVESPPIIDAPGAYGSNNAPAMVVRQIGEAWNKAFATVYEPFFQSEGATIQSVDAIEQGGVVRGVRVVSLVDGETQIHHVISQPNASDTYEDDSIGLSFTGRYGVATRMTDGSVRLYVGDGSGMSYRGNTASSTSGGMTQFEAYFIPGMAPSIKSNAAIETESAMVPKVLAIARGADGVVTILGTGALGTPYRLEASATMKDGKWIEEASGIVTESPFQIEASSQGEDRRFYRVVHLE